MPLGSRLSSAEQIRQKLRMTGVKKSDHFKRLVGRGTLQSALIGVREQAAFDFSNRLETTAFLVTSTREV